MRPAAHGFAEGAQVYFGKDMKDITLPEAALLAGIIQSPNMRNPFRYPDRAKGRRNVVLGMMLFKEPHDVVRLVCLALIIVGAVGLKFVSPPPQATPPAGPTTSQAQAVEGGATRS